MLAIKTVLSSKDNTDTLIFDEIAAMADTHFVIEKNSTDNHTVTDIRLVEGEQILTCFADASQGKSGRCV